MITVTNGYKTGWVGENKVYIGRASYKNNISCSPLANPFILEKHGDREEVIAKYKLWLLERLKLWRSTQTLEMLRLANLLKDGKDLELVCYCSPKACHGDVIKEILDNDFINKVYSKLL